MKSGSREIQKIMERQVPLKHREMKKQWFARAARFYGCTITKAEDLYYREGRSIPNEIYVKLTAYPTAQSGQKLQKLKRLEQSEIRDDEINQIIGDKIEHIIHNALGGYLASLKGVGQRTTG